MHTEIQDLVTTWVERAAQGDELAWRHIYSRYTPLLHKVAGSYRLSSAERADAVASAWLKLVESVETIREGRHVGAWLVTTVRRECLSRLRRGRREHLVDDFVGVAVPTDEVDFDRRLAQAHAERQVGNAMVGLSARDRRLLTMLFADDAPSYDEIGCSLSMPLGSIGPTRARALRKLRDSLSEEDLALVSAS